MSTRIFLGLFLCIACAFALDNGLARTPPMGWNTWNYFQCTTDCTKYPDTCISEKLIMQTADAMVSSGMADAGYEYVNLDDCWLAPERDQYGRLQPDPERFPSGIKALADYVHNLGLKFGIYEDSGNKTCEGYPGSNSSEIIDVATFMQWGVDYVKLDGCGFSGYQVQHEMPSKYIQWSELIQYSGRPMVFSCSWPTYADLSGIQIPWDTVADICNLWREWIDIRPDWSTFMNIIDYQEKMGLDQYAGPGHWNDPDMLEVGIGSLTYDEEVSHFSLWAMLAAPLIAGVDLRNMSAQTIEILTNKEVIAVDQDPAGIQGYRVLQDGGQEVWVRPLANGDKAVLLLNRNTTAAVITAPFKQIGWTGSANVRDLWQHTNVGVFQNSYNATVAPHGVVMLRFSTQGAQEEDKHPIILQ